MKSARNGPRTHLTTHEATVTTAAVEIKTLTIRGKQVTLAVFRQLTRAPLIEWETQTFQGIPWGHVNYHPSCVDVHYHDSWSLHGLPHLHVVWQLGEELRQDVIPQWPGYAADRMDPGAVAARDAFLARWRVLYAELSALDQLFIAV